MGSSDAMYNLATAAAAVGRNKNAILRAIEAGKIPASKDATGEMHMDPADLHRIYPPLRTDDTQQQHLYQSPLLMPVGGYTCLASSCVCKSCYHPWSSETGSNEAA